MSEIVYNKNGVPFDIDAVATDLNGKMDRDGTNSTNPVMSAPYVVSRTANSNGGVTEIWSDGYCVQTGVKSITSGTSGYLITLDQSYISTNYLILVSASNGSYSTYGYGSIVQTVNTFKIYYSNNDSRSVTWEAKGYIR